MKHGPRRNRLSFLACILLLGAGACAPGLVEEARDARRAGDYERSQKLLEAELALHPRESDAWRELGIIHFHRGESGRAIDALREANRIRPDCRTYLYLGYFQEQRGDADSAVASYQAALNMHPRGEFAELVLGRLQEIELERARTLARRALAAEESLSVSEIADSSIAVYGFDSSRLPAEIAPLARGIAELTSLDLMKVRALKVLERLRIDALQREMALDSVVRVDPATAPRIGRLLGGRTVVTGSMTGLADEQFSLHGVLVDVADNSLVQAPPIRGDLDRFFRVQKDLTFSIIDSLGVELSPEEREAIALPATTNYVAFLTYSRGLEFLSQARFPEARDAFRSAYDLDPGFVIAGQRADQLAALLSYHDAAGGPGGPEFSEHAAAAAQDRTSDLSIFDSHLASGRLGVSDDSLLPLQESPPDAPPRTGLSGVVGVDVTGGFDDEP
ncbi:MAG: tetratricopeptide repeat protein [Candidatus Krumholzibacteriota bacterium]|nr:tetratricopeptide repeat protein [Candidatus Krumholzibacteriota bacterium]